MDISQWQTKKAVVHGTIRRIFWWSSSWKCLWTDRVFPWSGKLPSNSPEIHRSKDGSDTKVLDWVSETFVRGVSQSQNITWIDFSDPKSEPLYVNTPWIHRSEVNVMEVKQSICQWNEELSLAPTSLGLTVSSHDPSLYYRMPNGFPAGLCVVHVENVRITRCDEFFSRLERGVLSRSEISLNWNLPEFLSLKVTQDQRQKSAIICQTHCIKQLGYIYFPEGPQNTSMPCDTNLKDPNPETIDHLVNTSQFVSLIGGFL